MTEEELKKKLSLVKTSQVPKGYWENYWPRLQMKLDRVTESEPQTSTERIRLPWRGLVPVLSVLIVGIVSFRLGQQQTLSPAPQLSTAPVLLTSEASDAHAQTVFKEMLKLFPNRVNWISFVDGKVDFSISSVAYQKNQALVPMVVAVRRPKEDFQARFLMRAGQETTTRTAWDKKTNMELKLSLDAAGQEAHVSVRLNDAIHVASVEGTAALREGQDSVIGALRWGSLLTQVQLTRPALVKHFEQSPV